MIPINYPETSALILAILLLAGLALLYFGGNYLCKGAESIALILGVNPLIIGLTIVAMATSMPELFTSFYSAWKNEPDIAIGNIVGSNLVNIGLILGVSALISPLKIHASLIKKELPLLFAITVLFYAMAYSGSIGHVEGLILLAIFFGYLYLSVKNSKIKDPFVAQSITEDIQATRTPPLPSLLYIIGGTLLLQLGAELLVNSSVQVATRLGLSQVIIGLTIVAIGTSLPEMAASIVAAKRNQPDIAIGNIVGSNLFNILFIGGSVSSFIPVHVHSTLISFDIPALILLTAVLWRFFVTNKPISKREGFILLVLYLSIMITSIIRSN